MPPRFPHAAPLACLLPAFAFLAGCADTAEPVSWRTLPIDYRGPQVREFFVEGTSTVTVEPSYVGGAEREARALELVAYKHIVLEWYLYLLVADHMSPDRETLLGEFHAHVRNGATADLELTDFGDGTYSFRFRGELSAPLELFDLLPDDVPDSDAGLADAGPDGGVPPGPGTRHLPLPMPVLDNEEMSRLEPGREWYRAWGRSLFDPATYEGELETVDLTVTPEERSQDGYIDHGRLLGDGRLTIGIHVGWDYYPERFDRLHAMQVYDWLVAEGFRSPAESFDYYGIDSGPLTKTVLVGGRPVEVEVTLVHSLQGDPAELYFARRMKDALLESLREREVVVYLGHSGNRHGFLLSNWNVVPYEDGALLDHELPSIGMSDAYQIVLADGCHTYSMGEPFWANPAKAGRTNLDLVATTNLSVTPDAGDHAVRLLIALVGRDGRPPRGTSYDELLGAYRPLETYMGLYGVHGIDDNPRLNPLADVGRLCEPCGTDEDCGASGNACLRVNRRYVCLPECLADDGCPAGTVCREHEDRIEWGRPHGYCTPADGVCEWTAPDAGTDAGDDVAADAPPGDAPADAGDAGDPSPDGTLPPTDVAGDSSTDDPSTADPGCGCRAAGPGRLGPGLVLGLLALLSLRRGARRSRTAAGPRSRRA
ncbi:MAG: hypothetical protein JXB32_19105 [Deltaproteobacteria bacterium]|nr:hypothetical protein [Deltaproteobacteria bacterium]